MGLDLFMIGLLVRDMPASVAFYRRLGIDIAEGSEQKTHVEVKMGGLTFFLDSNPARWDPRAAPPAGSPRDPAEPYPMILELYLKTQAAVDSLYREMTESGAQGFREPYVTSFGMRFAMLSDPDGNVVLLSGDAAP